MQRWPEKFVASFRATKCSCKAPSYGALNQTKKKHGSGTLSTVPKPEKVPKRDHCDTLKIKGKSAAQTKSPAGRKLQKTLRCGSWPHTSIAAGQTTGAEAARALKTAFCHRPKLKHKALVLKNAVQVKHTSKKHT